MKDKGLLNKGITVLKYVTIVVIAIAAVQITANLRTKYETPAPKTTKLGFENVG